MERMQENQQRLQENQQRIIEKQQSENNELKSKMSVSNVGVGLRNTGATRSESMGGGGGGGLASFGGLAGLARNLGLGSQPNNSIPTRNAPPNTSSKGNLNDILNKLKQNLPKNDEASSVTEENTSDRRILMSSTVDSDKLKGKASLKGRKSVLSVRR
jgi:hypothetical protein